MPNVLILSGSPSRTSRLNGMVDYAQTHLQEKGLKVGVIRVSDLPAEALITADFEHPAIRRGQPPGGKRGCRHHCESGL